MQAFAAMLRGGDRRSIGRADEVAALLAAAPARLDEAWQCLADGDPVVRMRAADALEKFSRDHEALFAPYRDALLSRAMDDGTPELRWHLIAMTSRLRMDAEEVLAFSGYLQRCLRDDPSRIVKVAALQAVFDMRAMLPDGVVREAAAFALGSSWASVRARARRLWPMVGG